jgi:adenylosuccinate lyase
MLHRFDGLMENLRIYPEQMEKNLNLLGGVVNSQRILLELARKGMDRQAAYVIVQRNAMKMYEEGVDFRQALLSDADLLKMMTPEEINDCFSTGYHTRQMDEIFRRVFGRSA